jgi:predicted small lipoprotein YifL
MLVRNWKYPLLILSLERATHRAAKLIVSIVLIACLVTLTACGASTPPLSLAPNKQLVEKAIALQISQTQQRLTQRLQSAPPNLDITQLTLKQLEPLFLDSLATYHIWGTYSLKIKLPSQQITQQQRPFDVYLQRQPQGKTWRLVIPERISNGYPVSWRTYLIP